MITLSKDRFEHFLKQRRASQDPGYREVWQQLALGRLDDFWKAGGMAIGAFAWLVDLPVSTVRHYLGLGLLEAHYKVDGKYRFHPFNCWEVQSVQQWHQYTLPGIAVLVVAWSGIEYECVRAGAVEEKSRRVPARRLAAARSILEAA